MVIKPAPDTPFSALAFGDLALKIGLPSGVLNIITGDAPEIGKALCESPDVGKITFTGSTGVGKLLAAQAGAHMKRISMELGGNAPFIVFDDADLEQAIKGAMLAKFRNSGQTCVCANRIFVQKGIYDDFAKGLAAAMAKIQLGDGREKATTQGPLINQAAFDKVRALVEDARANGAEISTHGAHVGTDGMPSKLSQDGLAKHGLGGDMEGYFHPPTLVSRARQNMRIYREEIFGPVAALFPFETEDEVVQMANDTQYGLAAYAYTQNLGRAWRLSRALDYGMVGINAGVVSHVRAPFGGIKSSGMGREGSHLGLDDYLQVKHTLFGGLDA